MCVYVAIYGVDVDAAHVKQLRMAGLLNLGCYQALFFFCALVTVGFYGFAVLLSVEIRIGGTSK